MSARRHGLEDTYEYESSLASMTPAERARESRRKHGICTLEELAEYYGISAFWLGDEADQGRLPSLATSDGRLFNIGVVGGVLAKRAEEGMLWGGGDGVPRGTGVVEEGEASAGKSGMMSAETAAALEARESEAAGGREEWLEWVFHAIDDPRATVETAPSRGAWSWLVRLRADGTLQQRFYEKFLDSAMKARGKAEAVGSGESESSNEIMVDGAGIESLIGAVMDDLVKGVEGKLKVARA